MEKKDFSVKCCFLAFSIKDFKIVDYGRVRRLDAYSVDWVEYGKRARKFAACCHLRSPSDGRR